MSAAPEPGTAVAERDDRTPAQILASQIRSDQFKSQVALALPEGVGHDRFVRATVTALLENPELAEKANHESIFMAVIRAAQDGLLPDGREAAIAIYKGKAQYLPMIGGIRKAVGEFGWQISATVVYERDEFDYSKGTETVLVHKPARGDRGERVAAYATAKHISGSSAEPIVMWAEDIAKRRAKAQTPKVWDEWTDRMWEKTVAKALAKELPKVAVDPRIQRILAADDLDYDTARGQLYGNGAVAALPAPTPDTTPADAAPTMEGNGGQQVDPAESTDPGLGAADTSAPGEDEEPEPAPAAAATSPPADGAAEAAGKVVVPSGKWQGKTVAEVALDENGREWFAWILKAGQPRRDETHREHLVFRAADTYAAAHPEVTQ